MARKIALLIGNSTYDDERLGILSAPWTDVVDLEKVLQEVGGFETVPLFNAGLIDARRAIGGVFKDRSPDDLVLLYYTGHGVRDDYGDLFFALPHTDIDELRATSLGANFIRTEMDRSTSRRQILILDCCHSGAFMHGGAKRVEGEASLNRADFVDPVGHGRFVLAASAANESAFERDGRSLFTRHLVDGLVNGTAAPEKEEITIGDLHAYLCRGVSAEKAPMQPRLWVDEQTYELVVARNPNPRRPIPPELIKFLGDADPYRALGAATQLIAIYRGPDPQQSADAEKALRHRLASPENLPVLVADPIRAALLPTAAPEPTAEVKAMQQQPKEEERKLAEVDAALEPERETHPKKNAKPAVSGRPRVATTEHTGGGGVRRTWTPTVLALILLGGSVLTGSYLYLTNGSLGGLLGYGGGPDGFIKDCPECPTMVVIPADDFTMGSNDGHTDERPPHLVTVPRFALAKTEVTFDQWEACVDDGGCTSNSEPSDEGWGTGTRPVINVSWTDAQGYVDWLNSKVDGAPYRLPTEAEWEYAARSGAQSAYPWGDADIGDHANSDGTRGVDIFEETAPVGSFPVNGFGLHDMHGNVREWVQDCWHETYNNAPEDGAMAWEEGDDGDCSRRVVRGGSWVNYPEFLRSAIRFWFEPENRSYDLGFRPARTLLTP